MLTVKAIYAVNHEEIFEAKRVWTVPLENSVHINVMFEPVDTCGEMGICTADCHVFIMNDKGHTVANYH
jgi:hypothetical protein